MRKSILGLSALALFASATPALAQDDSGLTVSGSVALVSDYRFRGVSQTNQNAAIQAGITVEHTSGFYFGTWGSNVDLPNLDNAGNGATAEIDFFAGYAKEVAPGVTVDVGMTYYLYPKDTVVDVATDFFEPYVTVSGDVGPVALTVGAYYAWEQDALGGNDSLYLKASPSVAIPGSPFSLDGHVGYAISDGFPGGVDGEVFDWSAGATASWQSLTFGVHYVDTNEPGFIRGRDAAVVFSVGASF